MGNIAFNSFKKNVSDQDFTNILREIVNDRFPGKAFVEPNYHNDKIVSWLVAPVESLCPKNDSWRHDIVFIRESKRKFGTKHPHSDWGKWFMAVIQNELAERYNGRISDEGVSGSWSGNTRKFPTFRSWMERMYPYLKESNKEAFEHMFNLTPKSLRDL